MSGVLWYNLSTKAETPLSPGQYHRQSTSITGQLMSSLTVSEIQGQLVVDSRLIATELGIQHENLRRTIDKYLNELQGFGVFVFQNGKPPEGTQVGRPERYCFLNEDQAIFLMTLSKNTPQVVACKIKLVTAFAEARKAITQPTPQSLPTRDAAENLKTANDIENLNNKILQQLLRNQLISELSVAQGQNKLPSGEPVKQYTICVVRAAELGYSIKHIGNGSALGAFVVKRVTPAYSERVGQWDVNHYEITGAFDNAIKAYFEGRKGLHIA
jgi:phage regulator Rha-like protein